MLAWRLAGLTQLPLYPLDLIQFRGGGGKVAHEDYLKAHADLIRREEWIIDGFGCVTSAWERFAAADTLNSLLVGDKAFPQSAFRGSGRMAREQSDVAQHAR